ncbi:MAG: NADH-ubiquinone oxidoreductase-F iron-sulfur binding region domain-containing protein [Oscillospiraceae bacterium]
MSILTREGFRAMRETAEEALRRSSNAVNVLVCAGTGCIAGGSLKVCETLKEECERRGLQVYVGLTEHSGEEKSLHIKMSGCHGFCEMGPLVHIEPLGVMYIHVKPEDCCEIVEKTVMRGEIIERLTYQRDGVSYPRQEDIPFYKKQHRVVLASCGTSDAEDLDEYIAKGGYSAFEKALFTMTPEAICKEISDSGLRGRGGGGFPAGRKWESVRRNVSDVKYVVCNGDEGDPGAFMDRSIMEGNPHSILEGMMIAGVATGATEGYIYVRAEYPLAVKRLQTAIEKAAEVGLLGDDIMGSGFCFHMHINRGAGAFVCGEGSALTASIEGKRGMPRVKPPRTVDQGLWGKPTVLNNVETFANVPGIIRQGAGWYKGIGTDASSGTKTFALTGNVVNTGLVEVPMGTTLREVIFDIGGGIPDGKKFKAVQIGGPSGGCLTEEHLDVPMDFDSLKKLGAIIGSGGLVVMDEDTCMVEVARFFMNFTRNESCGKCTPCREGTKRMLETLERIISNEGSMEDLDLLEALSDTITDTALCGLGQTACKPVMSTLKNFRQDYLRHVVDKHCPICNGRKRRLEIKADLCKGCGKCARNCPMEAISGQPRMPYVIDNEKCIHCGACWGACPFGAIDAIEED